MAMKFWLASFTILFVLGQIYLLAADSILSLSINILGGVVLAIASNYNKGITSSWNSPLAQKATLVNTVEALEQQNQPQMNTDEHRCSQITGS